MFTVPGDITRCVLRSRQHDIRVLRPRKPPEKLLLAFRVGIRQVGPEEDVHSTRRDITRCVLGSRLPNIRVLRPRKPPEKLLAFRMGIRQVGPEEDVHSTRRYHQVRPTLSPTRYSCSPTSKTPGVHNYGKLTIADNSTLSLRRLYLLRTLSTKYASNGLCTYRLFTYMSLNNFLFKSYFITLYTIKNKVIFSDKMPTFQKQ
ncbi:unnamed protein product [Trichogramma brassicae]|uniref:Uncharacterized protein n=1 Tax=Trichogramma brassicae TaxID=86971 RepID=A0A6H5ITP8_9HYME|nr:unnamed protein product [Trichogramma brassicae]